MAEFPHFDVFEHAASGDDPDGMALLCAYRIFERKGAELAAWATADPERLKMLRALFSAFVGVRDQGQYSEDVLHVAEVWRYRLQTWTRRQFKHWLEQAVLDLLIADGSLTREQLASLLRVSRKSLYRSEKVRNAMERAKARRTMSIPQGVKIEGKIDAESPI